MADHRRGAFAAGIGLLAFLVLAGSAVRLGVGWVYRVPTASMEPTILRGELVWAEHARGSHRSAATGDVVVLQGPRALLVKRVVAEAGDEVRLREGVLQPPAHRAVPHGGTVAAVGDRCEPAPAHPWHEAHARGASWVVHVDDALGSPERTFGAVTVPAAHVMVLGDNRDHSVDSRHFGPVATPQVLARVTRVLASLDPCTGRVRWDRVGTAIGP